MSKKKKLRPVPPKRPPAKWGKCELCDQYLPIVKETGMCGPCTTGDASTLLGDL
jgi:hypothetical protein